MRRPLQPGSGALLLALAFLLMGVGAASGPVVADAGGSAALAQALDAVPPGARATDSATAVQLLGGVRADDPDQARLVRQLSRLPGAGPVVLTGASLAPDSARLGQLVPFVEAGGRRERARLYAVEDPPARLAPVGGPPTTGATGGAPQVWLPQPVAEALGVVVGDPVVLGAGDRSDPGAAPVPVTVGGVYAVAEDGRQPVDPEDAGFWSDPDRNLPRDPLAVAQRSSLIVADPATVDALAPAVHDQVLWAATVRLEPPSTLPEAVDASAAVAELTHNASFLVTDLPEVDLEGRLPQVLSALPEVTEAALEVVGPATARTTATQVASVVLGLAAVLGSVLLGTAGRRRELGLSAALGRRARVVGALALVEVLPLALVATALGVAVAAVLVEVALPGPVTAEAVADGAARAGVLLVVGLVVVAVVTTLAARRAQQQAGTARSGRTVPWVPLVVVVAVTAGAGVLTRPAGQPGGLDLAVPLLGAAAAGALGGALLRAAARAVGARSARRQVAGGAGGSGRLSPGRATAVLALRRLGGPGEERLLVVVLVAAGLGLTLQVLAGTVAVDRAVDDKTAVLAGAETTVRLQHTSDVDPTLPVEGTGPGRDPVVAPGDSVVWRDELYLGGDERTSDLIVVDTATFADAAAWGAEGGPLAAGRAMLPELARQEAEVAPAVARQWAVEQAAAAAGVDPQRELGVPVPVLLAGDSHGYAVGEEAVLTDRGARSVRAVVVGTVPIFPGQGRRSAIVVGSEAYLPLREVDPRTTPVDPLRQLEEKAVLWSSRPDEAVVADLAALGVDGEAVTRAGVAARSDFAVAALLRDYQVGLALAVALVAVLALCLAAQRSAARARSTGVLLARAGLGRRGPLAALLLESAALVTVGLGLALLAVVGLQPLSPRLLDPAPWFDPALQPVLPASAVLAVVGLAVLAWLAAVATVLVSGRGASDEEVLRAAE